MRLVVVLRLIAGLPLENFSKIVIENAQIVLYNQIRHRPAEFDARKAVKAG
jgi:hypothetical protein